MLSLSEVRKIYTEMNTLITESPTQNLSQHQEDTFNVLTEYFTSKFAETSSIFTKFDSLAMLKFCKDSDYLTFEENQEIFKKGEECQDYFFLIYGDINLYDEEFSETKSNKLLKTLSAGSVYGHKIKAKFNYFAVAKNSIQMVRIKKSIFDGLIDQTNIRKEEFKTLFLKKFFPKFRMYSDDLIKTLKGYFIREQYEKNARIIVDHEFDEYVYIVIKGDLGIVKSLKRIRNLRENLNDLNFPGWESIKSVNLEKLSKGDIFGVYSALKHQKNNYSVTVLSEKAEIYKISKSHCLFYFGGSSGVIPEALKGLDSVQQVSLSYKIDFLERCKNLTQLQKFTFIHNEVMGDSKSLKKPIDESEITNVIKDSWKELENLGSKISEFKNSLLKPGAKNNLDVFAKLKTENDTESKKNKFFN
jgi:CRP-like cAMP-binding protein